MTSYNEIVIPSLGVQAVIKAFQDAMEDNEICFKNNREQLIDFYVSQQTDKDEYLRDYFNIETDPEEDPDYPHNLILAQLNITSKIIDKKAKNYILQPVRNVDGKPNDAYDKVLLDAKIKTTSKLFDRLTYLLGDHCIVIVADADKKKIRLDNPPYYRPVFKQGNNIDPVGVSYPIGLVKNNKQEDVQGWLYWDEQNEIIMEQGSWEIISKKPNVHKCFNVLFTHRMKPFRSHWTRDAQDLVDTNRDINLALTEINNALRYVGFPIPVATGVSPPQVSDTKIDTGRKFQPRIKMRFDKLVYLTPGADGAPVDMKYLFPDVDWDKLINTIKFRIEAISLTWNVDIKWDLSGDIASGVALKILTQDNTEDLNEMKELYEEFVEFPMFEKIVTISQNVEWMSKIKGGDLTIDWPEQEVIESGNERLDRIQKAINLNLTNPIDEMIIANPDLTPKAAYNQYMKNVNVNKMLKSMNPDDMMNALLGDKVDVTQIEKDFSETP